MSWHPSVTWILKNINHWDLRLHFHPWTEASRFPQEAFDSILSVLHGEKGQIRKAASWNEQFGPDKDPLQEIQGITRQKEGRCYINTAALTFNCFDSFWNMSHFMTAEKIRWRFPSRQRDVCAQYVEIQVRWAPSPLTVGEATDFGVNPVLWFANREEHPDLVETITKKGSNVPEKPKTPQQLWYNHEKKAFLKTHPDVSRGNHNPLWSGGRISFS